MKKTRQWLAFLLLLVISTPPVLGHTPLQPDVNESLDTAQVISHPTKSWAIYAELHERGEAHYYKLPLETGNRLTASLFIPITEKGFLPTLVVLGPGISSNDEPPQFLEVPYGAGVLIVEPNNSEIPEYEPFTPSSYYYLAEFDLQLDVPGDYYVAVYGTSRGGRYGLALGYREVFGIDEWLRVPLDVLGIREWEGQSLGYVLTPLLVTVTGGLVVIWLKTKHRGRLRVWTASTAGLLYLGSGFMIIIQMAIALSVVQVNLAVLLTLVFAMLPVLLGLLVIRTGVKETFDARGRILIAVLGVLGLVTWSGLFIGPTLSVLSSILPTAK